MTSLVYSIFEEACKTTGLKKEDLEVAFLVEFTKATNTELQMELASIMTEKPEQVNLSRISVIKTLLAIKSNAAQPSGSTLILTQNLERNSFDQLAAQIEHDVAVISIYGEKFREHHKATYWKKLSWRSKQENDAADAVSKTFENDCVVVAFDTCQNLLKKWMDLKRQVLADPLVNIQENQIVTQPEHDLCSR